MVLDSMKVLLNVSDFGRTKRHQDHSCSGKGGNILVNVVDSQLDGGKRVMGKNEVIHSILLVGVKESAQRNALVIVMVLVVKNIVGMSISLNNLSLSLSYY